MKYVYELNNCAFPIAAIFGGEHASAGLQHAARAHLFDELGSIAMVRRHSVLCPFTIRLCVAFGNEIQKVIKCT